MGPMAMPKPAMISPIVSVRRRHAGAAWLPWIVFSTVGAVGGALVAWQIRSLIQGGSGVVQQDLVYLATVISVMISSGVQWLVLRRYRLDAFWWVPATVAANLVTATFVVPAVFNLLFLPSLSSPASSMLAAMLAGATALAASGLVVGAAQSFVLRASGGNIAFLWIPATMLGGSLTGASTTALSSQLLGMPAFATISLVAAAGAFLVSASQAAILVRILR